MRLTSDFDGNPANSPQNVIDVLEARFNFENRGVPMPLSFLVELLGVEEEESGGVKAIKRSVEEFNRWREGLPEPKCQVPTLREFGDYLFSPIFNFPKIVQELDSPSTSQVLDLLGTSQVVTLSLGAAGLTVNATLPKTLKVKIYMGSGWDIDFPMLDEGSPPDLFVKLRIQGLSIDESKVKKTKVQKNSWIPRWGEEFEFLLRSPDNASILFEVYDRDRFSRNDFAGKISLPVSELRMGIRAVPLYDKEGNQCVSARLLVRFMIV
uniref:Phosphoinositide phospholipase C 8 n=1 Tax=Noccaea caerulescens TaxID=107243 RepID=A0A1J3CUU3_NOCCA